MERVEKESEKNLKIFIFNVSYFLLTSYLTNLSSKDRNLLLWLLYYFSFFLSKFSPQIQFLDTGQSVLVQFCSFMWETETWFRLGDHQVLTRFSMEHRAQHQKTQRTMTKPSQARHRGIHLRSNRYSSMMFKKY